ncbi:ATP-binding cassette domain-containing protein [Iocasia frigidifontis]|uniref:ATP-binding cassette domain-containing protein n=1 Tax=Iocasia fonsfrigidae TaxID=2682810 RepID=A0A8A7KIS4_9FIRM|nr:sugar ABC transporter ATP-binding protein [Iocasia fonsfrigidae]QTL99708.1 ATP-binding cassette domain-containing protein [Iocasia fonsfrigidae]
MLGDKILQIANISKGFPGVLALNKVSFDVAKGEVHALVGENGAGKSTLIKVLSGVYTADSGKIFLKGKEINLNSPKEAQELGISIIYQEFSLVPYLSAVDNIFLGRELKKKGLLDRKRMKEKALEILAQIKVKVNLQKAIAELTVAEQQFIEIAKALSLETEILILDEPTASLTEREINDLFRLINTLKKQGITMIYISHHLEEIFKIADRVSCLRDGQYVGTELAKDCTQEKLIKMMVGSELKDLFHKPVPKKNYLIDEVLLDVKKLSRDNVVKDVIFKLKKGEILGIAGLVGAGRTETIRALIGADTATEKEVYLEGKKVELNNPAQSLKAGIGLIPENRKTQGLILGMSVKDNISLSNLQGIRNRNGFINQKMEIKQVRRLVNDLSIKTPGLKQAVKNLSGGNQQKVVLAKWLNRDCKILIFDEPTRGIDVKAKAEIHSLIQDLANQGIAIIVISSELPEVLNLSHRIMVMHKGKLVKVFQSKEASSEKIMYYATGGGEEDGKNSV